MTSKQLSAPTPITVDHDVSAFDCGNDALDRWLKLNALSNELGDASRTFVVCEGQRVVAYYALANGALARESAPKPLQRNMPNPIPVIILGRLAVDVRFQGDGLGSELLRDAFLRCLGVAENIGSKAVMVHAISQEARAWYMHKGFLESTHDPMTLCLPMATLRKTI